MTRGPRPSAAALVVGFLLVVTGVAAFSRSQATSSVELLGQAPPPASPLSLWYRQPATDKPLTTPRPGGREAHAEWVRALPVGNGRLGAMVFGGVVHERLQLNEDTLWAGRPYDPVNPEAKDALPEVRRLIAAGQYAEAAKLTSR